MSAEYSDRAMVAARLVPDILTKLHNHWQVAWSSWDESTRRSFIRQALERAIPIADMALEMAPARLYGTPPKGGFTDCCADLCLQFADEDE